MNEKSRSQNAIKNVFLSASCKVVDILVNFIARIFFVQFLGKEILGINGLFTNILSFLSLADLGINTAMTYSFYKPLANHDREKVSALVNFYVKIYFYVFLIVLIIGLLLIPFLPYFINLENIINNYEIYYVLLLLNSAVSYLFIYKSALLKADQNEYIISTSTTVVNILKNIVLIFLLAFYKNYVLYLAIQVLFTILNNMVISYFAKNKYPFLDKNIKLDNISKKTIFKDVKSVLIYKISSVLINSTDNIIISMIVGTIYVGFYSNYLLVINAVLTFIGIIFSSLHGSIGNLIYSSNSRNIIVVFYRIMYFSYLIAVVTMACLIVGLNDLIILFFGNDYTLDFLSVTAILVNFYLNCICQPMWTFRETAGLFKEVKVLILTTSIINIILSIILGKIFGVFGVLIATAIAKICTYFWKEPLILYKKFFKLKVKEYFRKMSIYIFMTLLSLLPSILINFINIKITFVSLTLKVLIAGILASVLFLSFNFKNSDQQFFLQLFTNFFRKIKSK